ncbi:MAG: DoxX family protein [Pseudomonadota bacterium]
MKTQSIILHAGRVLLASLFILGGINKILNFSATAESMTQVGLPFASLLLPMVVALELGGGLIVAFGKKGVFPVATALALFTLATNLVFHDFWAVTGREAELQLSLFFKNIAIAGGLLFVAVQRQPN